MTELVIPSRFCGPPRSGNGGWSAGALAARTVGSSDPHPPVQVTLRLPPALDTPLTVRTSEGRTLLEDGDRLVAEAETLDAPPADFDAVPATDVATAREATTRHPGLGLDTYNVCFVCGPGRAEGDGLRIFPGRLPDERMAAPWTPHPSTAGTTDGAHAGGEHADSEHADLACTWAALDCIGGWSDDLVTRPMLLGRMTAQVTSLPRIGEEHVLTGRLLRRDGRRSYTASTLRTAEGQEVARASHVWFAVDMSAYV